MQFHGLGQLVDGKLPIMIGNQSSLPSDMRNTIVLDMNVAWLVLLNLVYFYVDPVIGIVSMSYSMTCVYVNKAIIQVDENDVANSMFGGKFYQITLAVNLFCWMTQFVGHAFYERRAPALLTNFLFMYLGPFFVFFDILNKTIGYRQK